ncbi:MAG: hypothetical protein IPN90_05650 [Elusimicrobia bacterium]|nr:hypothetical protein [Elusimicrobiota bacterium]
MNNAMRYSLSAVFTSLATSYFVGVGMVRLIQTPRSVPSPSLPSAPSAGTGLATQLGVRDDLFRPLGAPPDPNEAIWRSVKGEQTSLKSQVDNQMATMLRVEEQWRGSDRKVDGVAIKVAETERLMQETKNALEAAQIRIGKMEGALKVAQDREQKATMTAKRMVKMFVTMSPEKAAKILEELPNGETADLLARMKEAEAAAILTLFPPKRAAALSARLAGNRGGTP